MYYKISKPKKGQVARAPFRVGNVAPNHTVRGGGGPANAGARTNLQANKLQPNFRMANGVNTTPWMGENEPNEYFGYAAPSKTPITAGLKRDNFRELGDVHGGRA